MKRPAVIALASILLVGTVLPRSSRAQETTAPPEAVHGADEATQARALSFFREGRELMAQKRYDEAIERFLSSEQLDPAAGTLLNLAYAYEKLGRTATAWAIYRQAASLAAESGRLEWSDRAKERVASLEGTLSRVTIETRADALEAGVRIFVDGAPLPMTAWGERIPLCPGPHEIRAEAESRSTWTYTFQVDAGEPPPIAVPELVRKPPSPPVPQRDSGTRQAAVPASKSTSAQRTVAIVLGGVGVAALAIAGGFALSAKSTNDNVHCLGGTRCTPDQVAENSSAFTQANVATATAAAGGAAVLCAAIVWFAFPEGPRSSHAPEVSLVPSAASALLGVSVKEAW